MIELKELTKTFGETEAVRRVSVTIREGAVFGLIGTNGAGKSTLLRLTAGILKPDAGLALVDNMPVYDNVHAKARLFFIADEPYFFAAAAPRDMERYYSSVYREFDRERFYLYLASFGLDGRRRISTFSKGMKKQLSIIAGLCARTRYLLCDETFDGLDPVMRQGVKSIFAREMQEREFTPVIASHNLRELEDICDHVGLLHQGGVLLSRDLEEMKCNIQKVQCVFADREEETRLLKRLRIVKSERRGSLLTLTLRGQREEIIAMFAAADCLFYEVLPLSLEEIFISETEVEGYDVKKIILG
ncbi:MAG: ABC transporter ATP-binding protein [Eubacteriales bacterium]|nr:ABC transporter ATP-binding protein [Eubacteriales bacterium]